MGIFLQTLLYGVRIGKDSLGNQYYRQRQFFLMGKRAKRWVVYAGQNDASSVTASWHAWLHYRTDTPPDNQPLAQSWQKPHLPNQTFNDHLCNRVANKIDSYQAWKP